MKLETQSGYAAFQPRARLMKLIGAELISDDVVAITELVKNAHDADASLVTLAFHRVTGDDGEIIITDDGSGMDLQALLTRWMEPANSWKRGTGRRSAAGRRVLGEKGVGRFAADKLASQLELVSRCRGHASELHAIFDWDQFAAEDRMLADVRSRWEIRPAQTIKRHGTILRMTGLRTTWNERMFRKLSTRLSRLISPFESMDGFQIIIESDEFPDYSGELRADILERAPYRIDAIFDGDQTVAVNMNGSRSVQHIWNGTGDLRCGPVHIRLFAFDLETDAIARIGPRAEVRAWLREWTGVSIYRDGFRIWPYGEPHDDWLRLDQRRVNNPVVRLSNNQIVGFVEISSDENPDLQDQTAREGLIQNRALEDLRQLMYFVFQLLEAERQGIRHPDTRNSPGSSRSETGKESLPAQLQKLAQRADPDLAGELQRFARRLAETLDGEEARQRRFSEGYSELAALGQAATGIQGTIHPLLQAVRARCEDIRGEFEGSGTRGLRSRVKDMEDALSLIERRLAMIAPMGTGGGHRRRRAIDIPAEIEVCRRLFEPLLDQAGIKIELDVPTDGVVRVEMRPEAFQQLLHILVSNSMDWLHGVDQPRISIRARSTDGTCTMIFSDNGPGIAPDLAERVFEPLFSSKEGGRGMGLTIARDIVQLHGGTIEVMTDRRRSGANIRVLLPMKRSRATVHQD